MSQPVFIEADSHLVKLGMGHVTFNKFDWGFPFEFLQPD